MISTIDQSVKLLLMYKQKFGTISLSLINIITSYPKNSPFRQRECCSILVVVYYDKKELISPAPLFFPSSSICTYCSQADF